MTISVRLNNEDTELFGKCAEMHNMSLSDLIRNDVLEKIEDEYDISIADEAYNDYVKSGKKSRPISELWKELDL